MNFLLKIPLAINGIIIQKITGKGTGKVGSPVVTVFFEFVSLSSSDGVVFSDEVSIDVVV